MSENDVNLAALWVPVMAETSALKGQLVKAGTEGGAASAVAFREAFAKSGAFTDIGNQLNRQFMGLSLPSGLLSGFEGLFSRTKAAEVATQNLIRSHEVLTDTLRREEIAQARLNELQESGAGGRSLLAATLAADVAHRNSATAKEADAQAEAKYQTALQRSSGSLAAFSSVANGVGIAATVGLGAAFVETTKKAGDFQASQERLVASAGETKAGMDQVSNGVLQLAGQVGYSAQQLSDAMYTVEKAGYRGAEGVNVLKAAAEGAKSENADLKEVLSGLTTTMSDFGLKAEAAPDVMSKMVVATGMAKTNFQDFSSALHSVEPIAGAVGQALDAVGKQHLLADVYGSLAQVTQSGMGAAQAAQNMGRAFTTLSNPTQKMRDELGQIGLNAQDVQQHLGERGLAGTVQLISDKIRSQMNPAGQVVIDTFLKSEQASGAAKKEFDALPPAAQKVAQAVKDGTLSFKEFRKSRGGLDVEDANLVNSWNTLNNKVTGFSTALKSGQGDIQTYMQALSLATGNQETARLAVLLTGDATDKTNQGIKQIDQTTREHDGTVKGFTETQSTLNAKMADAKAAFGAAAIEVGTAFIPVMTDVANIAKTVGDAMAKHPAILHGVVTAVEALSTAWLAVKAINVVSGILMPTKVALEGVTAAEEAATVGATGLGNALKGLAGAAVGPAIADQIAHDLPANSPARQIAAGSMPFDPTLRKDPGSDPNDKTPGWLQQAYGNPFSEHGWLHGPWQSLMGHADGGQISGSGPKGKDSVPAWLAPGEHVLTAAEVDAMGGQAGVYAFRKALHHARGGSISESGGISDGAFDHLLRGGDRRPGRTLHRQGGGAIPGYDQGGAPGTQDWLNQQLQARGLSPSEAKGILAMNQVEGGASSPMSLLGFTESQAHGPQGHVQAFMGQWNDPSRRGPGGQIPGVNPGGDVQDWNAYMTWIRQRIVGQNGSPSDWQGNAQPAPGVYQNALMTALHGGNGALTPPGGAAALGTAGNPIYTAPTAERAARADAHVKEIQERLGELKPDAKQSTKDRLHDELGFAQEDQARAHAKESEGGGSGSGQGKTESQAQQFGSGLLSGAMSDMGFGNVLGGKSPFEWPLVKMFTGLASAGLSAGNAWAESRMAGGAGGVPGLNTGGVGSAESVNGLGGISAGMGDGQGPSDTGLGAGPGGGGNDALSNLATSPLLSISKFAGASGSNGPGGIQAGPGSAGMPGLPQGSGAGVPSWQGMVSGGPNAPKPGSPDWYQQMQQQIAHPGTPQNVLPPVLGLVPGVTGLPSNGPVPNMPSYHGAPQVVQHPSGATQWHFATGGFVGGQSGPYAPNIKWGPGRDRNGVRGSSGDNMDNANQGYHHPPLRSDDGKSWVPWDSAHQTGFGTDTVPAWLSPGEFVVNASATKRFGPQLKSMNAQHFASGGSVSLTPSSVSSVPMASSHDGGTSYSGGHHITNDNRIIVHGNHMTDADQLVGPMQEKMNSQVYSRSQFGGLPMAVGPGGG